MVALFLGPSSPTTQPGPDVPRPDERANDVPVEGSSPSISQHLPASGPVPDLLGG